MEQGQFIFQTLYQPLLFMTCTTAQSEKCTYLMLTSGRERDQFKVSVTEAVQQFQWRGREMTFRSLGGLVVNIYAGCLAPA